MKITQVVFKARDQVVCETDAMPSLGESDVLVRTEYSVISPGTELAFLRQLPNTIDKYPMRTGYSSSGKVIQVGKCVQKVRPGQSVAVQMAHASAGVVTEDYCWAIPFGLDLKTAAGFRLVSISLQGVRKAQLQLGECVLVLGLGIIGNMAGQLARAAGATRVVGTDPLAWRRAVAAKCGFDDILEPGQIERVLEMTEGKGPQVVIEATGAPEAIKQAFQYAGRLARVVLLGSTRGSTPEINFYRDVHKKGLTIIGAHEYIRATHEDVGAFFTHQTDGKTSLQLLASGRIEWRALPAKTFPGRRAPQAYEQLLRPNQNLMYAALEWVSGAR